MTRFVAVNLLFTTSPLYDPLVAAPGVGGRRVAHAEILEMHRKSSGLDWIDMDFVADELIGFQPYYDWQPVVERTRRPLPIGTRQAVRIATGLSARPGCWEEFGWAFAQLFCYFDKKYDVFVPEYGPKDYVAAAFGYNGSVAVMGNVPWGSPTTIGVTARSLTCSCSPGRKSARRAMALPPRLSMNWGTISGCPIRMTATIPSLASIMAPGMSSSLPGRAMRPIR